MKKKKEKGLMRTAIFAMALLAVVTGLGMGTFRQALLENVSNMAAVISSVLVDLANISRSQSNIPLLSTNAVLQRAAQAKADDMAAKGYFAHVSPEGFTPWHWFGLAGYQYSSAGENLAVDFSDSGAVNQAWMNSPTHRANIMNGIFTEIGTATAEGYYKGRPATFVVEMFGRPLNIKNVTLGANNKPLTVASSTTFMVVTR